MQHSPVDSKTLAFYQNNAAQLRATYNTKSFHEVHPALMRLLPLNKPSRKALDVGCGSGRDAFALANFGFNVVAVDPCEAFLERARTDFFDHRLTFKNDSLPSLDSIQTPKNTEDGYDVILLSAVWMHLPPSYREEAAARLSQLLAVDGLLAILIRQGKFDDGRISFVQPIEPLIELMSSFGIELIHREDEAADLLLRPDVRWNQLIFKKIAKSS